MIHGRYTRIDFRIIPKERRNTNVKIGTRDENKIIVIVKKAFRGTEGKQKGKIVYETIDSIDVFEASPDEVLKVISGSLHAASAKK